MFYVYYGYCSPDNYDSSEGPTYKIRAFQTAEEVADFRAEFEENLHDECTNAMFRIFDGVERRLISVEVVKQWVVEQSPPG